MAQDIKYYLDGVDMASYGVYVSASKGLLSRPKAKASVKENWTARHGVIRDNSTRYVEERTITLDCFIKTTGGASGFATAMNTFLNLFAKAGTIRLMVEVSASNPLVYEVYLEDSIDPDKIWQSAQMTGTFRLVLKEPSPVKRVIKFVASSGRKTASITITTSKIVTIYWGDGNVTDDVSGTSNTVTHTYSSNGTYFIIVAGVIEEITALTTTGTVIWQKL